MLFFFFFYVTDEIMGVSTGVGVAGQSLLELITSYLLYILVPPSLLILPFLLAHLMTDRSVTADLPLPERWRPLCLAAMLPTCGLVMICTDSGSFASNPAAYVTALLLVHGLAGLLQLLVVLLAGGLLATSAHSCQAHLGDIMQVTAGSCQAVVQQQRRIATLLGPFFMFFFAMNCFALMFYTFDIFAYVSNFSSFSVGLLIYATAALGKPMQICK
jgi:hypothetical protein